jgi:hypothetical protein
MTKKLLIFWPRICLFEIEGVGMPTRIIFYTHPNAEEKEVFVCLGFSN